MCERERDKAACGSPTVTVCIIYVLRKERTLSEAAFDFQVLCLIFFFFCQHISLFFSFFHSFGKRQYFFYFFLAFILIIFLPYSFTQRQCPSGECVRAREVGGRGLRLHHLVAVTTALHAKWLPCELLPARGCEWRCSPAFLPPPPPHPNPPHPLPPTMNEHKRKKKRTTFLTFSLRGQ